MIKEGKKVQCAIIYNELFGETGIVKQAGAVVSSTTFACCDSYGSAIWDDTSHLNSIRPVFLIGALTM